MRAVSGVAGRALDSNAASTNAMIGHARRRTDDRRAVAGEMQWPVRDLIDVPASNETMAASPERRTIGRPL